MTDCESLIGERQKVFLIPFYMRKFILIISFVSVSLIVSAQEHPDSVSTTVGYVTSIQSEHLEQSRTLYVHLPEEYDPGKSYPLVILLDGEATFRAFASVTALMGWQGLIPGCIVVGIPNINREMDYAPFIEGVPGSGNASKMLSFYRDELLPFLERQFRIGEKILYGHSWVGFFTTYVMLKEPELFDAYIATSPMFRFFDQVFEPSGLFGQLEGRPVSFYSSLGGEETMSRELEKFIQLLGTEAPESLQWKFTVNEGKNHDSNAITGYMDGLEFTFSGTK
jgi:hypothetical protein